MKYRKKPVVIEAHELSHENKEFLTEWLGPSYLLHSDCAEDPSWLQMKIDTQEGPLYASMGDMIIKGVAGEFYPCKPEIFEQTYEKVEEER